MVQGHCGKAFVTANGATIAGWTSGPRKGQIHIPDAMLALAGKQANAKQRPGMRGQDIG